MLGEARAKLAEAAPDRVAFLPPAGSRELARVIAPDFRFQVISAIQSHHYYCDRQSRREAVAACRALLAPGGLFLAFENLRPPDAEGLALVDEDLALLREVGFERAGLLCLFEAFDLRRHRAARPRCGPAP